MVKGSVVVTEHGENHGRKHSFMFWRLVMRCHWHLVKLMKNIRGKGIHAIQPSNLRYPAMLRREKLLCMGGWL